jgi:hypothetical protein
MPPVGFEPVIPASAWPKAPIAGRRYYSIIRGQYYIMPRPPATV